MLSEEPVPLKIVRNYPSYHETEDPREARAAIVALHLDDWSVKAIAGYLGVHHSTVYRALDRWKEDGFEALADGPPGRPPGVRKTDFAAIEAIRKLALNPGLGAFRVHAALEQMGFDLSRATCGRILAQIREVYGYEKPESGDGSKRAMPFAATERHEVWSAEVRHLEMVDEELMGSKAYAVTIMDNYSRASYVTLMRWRLYAEEALAGAEAELCGLWRTPSPSSTRASRSRLTRSPTRRRAGGADQAGCWR